MIGPLCANLSPLGAGQGFSPWRIPRSIAGLQLWVAADAISGAADGDPVATWADLSGLGNQLTQSNATLRPTLRTNVINGKPVVRFDGVSQRFAGGTYATDGGLTALMVVSYANTGAYHNLYDNLSLPMLWVDSGGRLELDGAGPVVQSPSGYSGFVVISTVLDAVAGGALYVDGALTGSNSTAFTVAGTLSLDHFNRAGGQTFHGDVAELLLYGTALADADRRRVEAYFSARYGIAV